MGQQPTPAAPVAGDPGYGGTHPFPLLQVGVTTGLSTIPQLGGGVPKGYLRVLVFNKDSVLVSQQTSQLSRAAFQNFEQLSAQMVLPQDGYVTAYVGTESDVDVYFDDVTVEHRQGLQVQETQYEPFGVSLAGVNYAAPGTALLNKFQFNDKERQTDLGLGWSDYGARFYDPSRGPGWMGVDPLADKMRRWSPYTFSFDNPIRFMDPDGMDPIDYYSSQGQYIGTDGVNDGVKKMVLTTQTEQLVRNATALGQNISLNPSQYSDIISPPTGAEFNAFDTSYTNMEANSMHEQAVAIGDTPTGGLVIGTNFSPNNTSVHMQPAYDGVTNAGGTVRYDAHTHGAVVIFDPAKPSGVQFTVGGSGPSTFPNGDTTGPFFSQPSVVLGYDVQKQAIAGTIPLSDLNAAQSASVGGARGIHPLNPASYNKTINFYNASGSIYQTNYSSFKSAVNNINNASTPAQCH